MPYRFHYTVYGTVQGVWFRWFAKQKADALGIVGWVKNDVVNTIATSLCGHLLMLSPTQGGSVSGVAIGASDSALSQL